MNGVLPPKRNLILALVLIFHVVVLTAVLLWFRSLDKPSASGPNPVPAEWMVPSSPRDDENAPSDAPAEKPESDGCVVSGCSGQLCTEENAGKMTTCEWRAGYDCYRQATCQRQADGTCSFTKTPELAQCLSGAGRLKEKNIEPW